MSSGSLGKGDKTGIAGVWIKGKRPSVEGEDITREMYYRGEKMSEEEIK